MGRCLGYDAAAVEEELRTQIWVDMLFKALDFCREASLAPAKGEPLPEREALLQK